MLVQLPKKEDHLKEIEQIHHYFDTVFHLNGWQKEEIEKRYRFFKKGLENKEVKI